MIFLEPGDPFPDVNLADAEGLLAIGNEITPELVIEAYQLGIFTWYNEFDPVLWWSPNPRCVLYPEELLVSKSMQKIIKNRNFTFTTNQSFLKVINACAATKRPGQDGTWISPEVIDVYHELHLRGIAVSAEAWIGDKLAGGLYGILLGDVFYGESMFSQVSNASKFAFIVLVRQLHLQGIKLIDCQMETAHLLSLGATMISRKNFIAQIAQLSR